jgi:hypothetical protein
MIGKFARKYTTIGDDPVFGGNACPWLLLPRKNQPCCEQTSRLKHLAALRRGQGSRLDLWQLTLDFSSRRNDCFL